RRVVPRRRRAPAAAAVARTGVRDDGHEEAAHLRPGPRRRVLRHARRAQDRCGRSGRRLPLVIDSPWNREQHTIPNEEVRIMIVTKKAIPRRTVLRGMGAALALPFLDGMVPAFAATGRSAGSVLRFGTMYVPAGVALKNFWPATTGRDFEFTPILEPLKPFKDSMLVLGGLSNREADSKGNEGV